MNQLWALPPLSPSPSEPNPLVLYRGGQSIDGFCAALAAWLFYGGRGDYLAVNSGVMIPDALNRDVHVLGASLSRPTLLELQKRAKSLVFIDCRKTWVDGKEFPQGCVQLDVTKSVARMAWEHFQKNTDTPAVIRFVEDSEFLRARYPETPAFIAHLSTEPSNFKRWSDVLKLQGRDFNDYVREGELMHLKFLHLAEAIANEARPVVVNGEPGLMVQAPRSFRAIVGAILSKRCKTYALMWHIELDQIHIELHSQANYYTLPMSLSMGGGGHNRSSSFRLHTTAIADLLAGILELEKLKLSKKLTRSAKSGERMDSNVLDANKALFHGLWSAVAFSSRYDKASWKSVHRQLIESKLID